MSAVGDSSPLGLGGTPGERGVIADPDLSAGAVYGHFWRISESEHLLSFLASLDRVDSWAIDHELESHPDKEMRLRAMRTISAILEDGVSVIHEVELAPLVAVLASLTTTRSAYLLRYLSQHNQVFLEALLAYLAAEVSGDRAGSTEANVILRRLRAFSNGHRLGEIFSSARIGHIMDIMRTVIHA